MLQGAATLQCKRPGYFGASKLRDALIKWSIMDSYCMRWEPLGGVVVVVVVGVGWGVHSWGHEGEFTESLGGQFNT